MQVHHVTRKHPYREVAKLIGLTLESQRPVVCGLSASLVYAIRSDKMQADIQQLCEYLSIHHGVLVSATEKELREGGFNALHTATADDLDFEALSMERVEELEISSATTSSSGTAMSQYTSGSRGSGQAGIEIDTMPSGQGRVYNDGTTFEVCLHLSKSRAARSASCKTAHILFKSIYYICHVESSAHRRWSCTSLQDVCASAEPCRVPGANRLRPRVDGYMTG
jgi:hypothetical protein